MLTTQSAMPDAVLQPFVQCYVQRISKAGEVIEPVFPRAGTMLIFQFAAIYEVKEYETEQRRRSWAATVIGPIDARRTRLILRDHVHSLDVLFRPLGMYRLFGMPISPLTGGGAEGHAVLGPQISSLYSVSAMRKALPIKSNCWTVSSSIGSSEIVRSIRQGAPCTGWPQADAT